MIVVTKGGTSVWQLVGVGLALFCPYISMAKILWVRKRLKFHVVNIHTDLLRFECSIRDDKKVRNFI